MTCPAPWRGCSLGAIVGQARCFTGALRRAIEVRDRECQWDGCHVPYPYCEIDHIRPHAEGGFPPHRPTCSSIARATIAASRAERPGTHPTATRRKTQRDAYRPMCLGLSQPRMT